DLVVRYGGDEFTAVCLGCRPGEIEIPINRVQQCLADPSFTVAGDSVPRSVSIGAAVRHDGFDACEPCALLIAAAGCWYRARGARGTSQCDELGRTTEGASTAEFAGAPPSAPLEPDGDDGSATRTRGPIR